MTKELLEARKAELQVAYRQTESAIVQAQANKHGIEGAIIECERWLKELEKPSPNEAAQE